jgi:hypothetical protein
VFLSQVNNSFASGSPTPDLVESDITYTAQGGHPGGGPWCVHRGDLVVHPGLE